MPLISVIMPTYNQLEYIRAAVDSVLGQTWKNLELIVVDDGSTDGTGPWLDRLDDPRVRVEHQENQGASAAMNRGFALARGEYLTWLASDNVFRPRFLEQCVAALEEHGRAVLVYTDFVNIDAQGHELETVRLEPYYPGLLQVNPGAVGVGFLYRRAVYERLGGYRDLVCNDLDYWLRIARQWPLVHLPEVLACNRKHGAMQTVVRRAELLRQVEERLRRERAEPGEMAADPFLMQGLTALRRTAEQLERALQLRIPEGADRVAVVGAGPLADLAVVVLSAAGYEARRAASPVRPEPGEVYLALDFETCDALRRQGLAVVRLDCDHASRMGADF